MLRCSKKESVMSFRTMMQSAPARAIELFARLAETSDGAVKTRERLFAELKAELELHTSLEEQHLFPVLRRNAETKDLVADAIRHNKELRAKVAELDGMAKNDATFSERLADLQKVFRHVAPLSLFIPLYGSQWCLAVASDSVDPRAMPVETIAQRLAERKIGDLRFYHPAMHAALFTLPLFVQDLVGAPAPSGSARVAHLRAA